MPFFKCELAPGRTKQDLSQQEIELRLRPEWVDVADAYRNNERILGENHPGLNPWVGRETLVLKELIGLLGKNGRL